MRLCFHETPRQSPAQVAEALGLSETRVKQLIRKASLAIPMVVDAVPVEVRITRDAGSFVHTPWEVNCPVWWACKRSEQER